MLELKEAYEILGLEEGASREEIEKKYGKLVKRYTADKSGEADHSETLSKVNVAYNRIVAYENELLEAAEPKKKPNPVYKLFRVDEKKASNFIHYHKYHFIVGAFIIILALYLGNSIFNRHIPDISVEFIGNFAQKADDVDLGQAIKDEIIKNIPNVKDVEIIIVSASEKEKSQQGQVLNTKANMDLAYGEADIMIIDKRFFRDGAENGIFTNLDGVLKDLKIDEKVNRDYKILIEGQKLPHYYGVDVSKSSIIKNSDILGKEYIAVIRPGSKHMDKAKKVIRLLLQK